MHVVVAVIVQNTLEHASHRNAEEHSLKDQREKDALKRVMDVFQEADEDGNGEVSKVEFLSSLEKPSVTANLHEVNVDVRQAEDLFDILDYDESGTLDASEFIEGVMAARGEAQAKEVLAVQCDFWKSELRTLRG